MSPQNREVPGPTHAHSIHLSQVMALCCSQNDHFGDDSSASKVEKLYQLSHFPLPNKCLYRSYDNARLTPPSQTQPGLHIPLHSNTPMGPLISHTVSLIMNAAPTRVCFPPLNEYECGRYSFIAVFPLPHSKPFRYCAVASFLVSSRMEGEGYLSGD